MQKDEVRDKQGDCVQLGGWEKSLGGEEILLQMKH